MKPLCQFAVRIFALARFFDIKIFGGNRCTMPLAACTVFQNKNVWGPKKILAFFKRKPAAALFCKISCLIFVCFGISACQFAGTIFTGARKVTTLVLDDRPLNDDVADTGLNLKLRDSYIKLDSKLSVDIDVTVFEGRVLLTGAVGDIDLVDKIVEVTWCTDGVKKVYNYIRIAEPLSIEKVNFDAAVSAKIRTQLMITKDVSSSNYKIVMENGTVYIMGIAQNIEELERVVRVIKDTVGVQKVVPLIRYN